MKTNSILATMLMVASVFFLINCGETIVTLDKVDAVVMSPPKLFLTLGQKYQLTAVVFPSTAKDKSVLWNTKIPAVATVDGGLVTAKGVGTTLITVTTKDGAKVATCDVTVSSEGDIVVGGSEPVAGVAFDPFVRDIYIVKGGESMKISAMVLPENARDKSIIWSKGKNGSENSIISSDDRTTVIATYEIDPTNDRLVTIKGVEVGTGLFYAIPRGDETKYGSMKINVIASSSPESIVISPTVKSDLGVGNSFSATALVMPLNTKNRMVKWSNSKTDNQLNIYGGGGATIATYVINPNNSNSITVTGTVAGTGTITATSEEGNLVSTLQVTVVGTTPILATKVQLDKFRITMAEGKNIPITIVPTISPSGATNKSVSWSSSNLDVAKVVDGVVTAEGVGLATIIATSDSDPSVFATCLVKVLKVYTLTIGESANEDIGSLVKKAVSAGFEQGNNFKKEFAETVSGSVYITPSIGESDVVSTKSDVLRYKSFSDYEIIAVGMESMAYKKGNVGLIDIFIIEVVDKTTLKIDQTDRTLGVNDTFTLTVNKIPNDVKVTWSSSKVGVATVDNTTGMVTAKASGTTVITAKANTKTSSITVTVR